jgi:methionyl-tRNA formyltransferase
VPAPAGSAAGSVVSVGPQAVSVATGDGVLDLLELQRAGARRLAAADFLRGCALAPGTQLG